ncbi:AAA family ATPase [Aggregicoccus sp. 17bor-14]|uniref:ATPase domain-containing protein n=1 Tax=Myxococcaceae TaxID=31 RepID=UPI00129D1BA1|nr:MULTISPECIES: ATPase domain-containing protein [Myxococcaceae]MBF5045242.1 AAA family ATPase [Simulacricoccus sp. 17bor-14]MRI90983.1 AAA family ATPase [Aggregicoccus sp. 17bor-14]
MSAVESPSVHLPRVSTGIEGLDTVLHGGLLQGGTYIVVGMPGAGKTILGNQFCYHHVKGGGRVVYVTLLAETHSRMLAHLREMDFFTAEPLATAFQYVSAYRTLVKEGLAGLLESLRKLIREHRASLLVIDGLVSATHNAANELAFKEFIHELNTLVGVMNCTTLLLTNGQGPDDVHPEHTMVDGLIELKDELVGVRSVRHLNVRKFRGSAHLRGEHTFVITGHGITVYPRLEAQLGENAVIPQEQEGQLPLGVPELDRMLGGGLQRGSVTLLMGPSGSGKTLLGLQFLHEGVQRNESCLYFGFYESPPRLMAKADGIGLHLRPALKSGLLQALWQPPSELLLDALGERLLITVKARGVKRLLLDGLIGFKEATVHPERINRFFAVLTNELRAQGVTAVFTEETRLLFGPEVEAPVKAMSALVENHLFLRQVEMDGELRRAITILKTRESNHETSVRELHISAQGFRVGGPFRDVDSLLTGQSKPRTERALRAKPPSKASPKGAKKRAPGRGGSK